MTTRWFVRPRTSGHGAGAGARSRRKRTAIVPGRGFFRFALPLLPPLAAALLFGGALSAPARAAVANPLTYNGSEGEILFGASSYGGSQSAPVWAPNSFTGRNDILASPGGNFPSINPAPGNTVLETGAQNFQTLSLSTGPNYVHTSAELGAITGPSTHFMDSPDYLAASPRYGIETWTCDYTVNQAFSGTIGTALGIRADVDLYSSSTVFAAMQTEVTITAPGGAPQTIVLDPLILGSHRPESPGEPLASTYVATGGAGASFISEDYLGHETRMLAVDSIAANLVAGSDIKVTSTLTFEADSPSYVLSIGPDSDLVNQIPGGLPDLLLAETAVPEPGSLVLSGTAVMALSFVGWVRRVKKRKAA